MFHPQVATPSPGGSLWPFGLRRTLRGAAPGGQRVRGRRGVWEVGEKFQRCSKWCSKWCFPCFFSKVHCCFPDFLFVLVLFWGSFDAFCVWMCECDVCTAAVSLSSSTGLLGKPVWQRSCGSKGGKFYWVQGRKKSLKLNAAFCHKNYTHHLPSGNLT